MASLLFQFRLSVLCHLAELGLVHGPVGSRNLVYEQIAVQMVGFVLNATCKKPFAIMDFLRLAIDVKKANAHLVRAHHIAKDFGERKAALVVIAGLGSFFGFPFRVEHDVGPGVLFAGDGGVDDYQTNVLPYLRGGQAATRGVVHGFQHVLCQLTQFRSNFGNGFAFFAEYGVAVYADGEDML